MSDQTYRTQHIGDTNIVCEGYSGGVDITILTDNRGDIIMYVGSGILTIRTDYNGALDIAELLEKAANNLDENVCLSIEDEHVVSSLEAEGEPAETDDWSCTRQGESTGKGEMTEQQKVDVFELKPPMNDPVNW